MFNSVYLDIAIGMVFIFLLYSLLASAVQEITATWLNLRGKTLVKGLDLMLKDVHMGDKLLIDFYDHPLIRKTRFSGKKEFPSYIEPEVFSIVVKDIIPDVFLGTSHVLTLKERLEFLPESEFKKVINAYSGTYGDKLNKILEHWFDISMDRLSGTYKKKAQNRILIIGFLISAIFNVDSLAVFNRLAVDKEARNRLISQAEYFQRINQNIDSVNKESGPLLPADSINKSVSMDQQQDSLLNSFNQQRMLISKLINDELKEANNAVGIGWEKYPGDNLFIKTKNLTLVEGILMLAGWSITALAITIGAPFWFDLLQKLTRIRGTGVKPLTANERKRGLS